jgi:hypothetical protein
MPGLPEIVEPVAVVEGEELVVYRVVRTPDPADPDFVESFKSHHELGLPPRGPEIEVPLIHQGISAYDRRDAAVETGRRYKALGNYVSKLTIGPSMGITYFRWGPVGHLTLWGEPLMLSYAVTDTLAI